MVKTKGINWWIWWNNAIKPSENHIKDLKHSAEFTSKQFYEYKNDKKKKKKELRI